MTEELVEHNLAALADQLVQQAAADAVAAGTTDTEAIKIDVTADAEAAAAAPTA